VLADHTNSGASSKISSRIFRLIYLIAVWLSWLASALVPGRFVLFLHDGRELMTHHQQPRSWLQNFQFSQFDLFYNYSNHNEEIYKHYDTTACH
jgi:hypothetical protein